MTVPQADGRLRLAVALDGAGWHLAELLAAEWSRRWATMTGRRLS